ncbi:MAG: GNAT family N-acetyltransferase [Pseudomonadota bacterium]
MWTDPDRHPYLIFVEKEPAGFAIVHWTGKDYDMEQFFVMRKFRRTGLGRAAAYRLFDMFRGPWGIEQITSNTVAQAFWRNVISGYTDDDFEDTLGDDPMQSFVS